MTEQDGIYVPPTLDDQLCTLINEIVLPIVCSVCRQADGHAVTCPVVTNYWTVLDCEEVECTLCEGIQEPGSMYRFIPRYPEAMTDEGWEANIGKARPVDCIVCLSCAALRVLPALQAS
jgi:hypothetical protein